MIGTLRAGVVLAMLGGLAAVAAPTATAGQVQSYIVVLGPGSSSAGAEAAGLAEQYGGQVGFVYEHALRGFRITASPAAAAALARNPRVAYVEADHAVFVDAQATPTGVERVGAPQNPGIDIDDSDDVRVDVDVAVIDTGIDLDHPDLDVVGSTSCLNQSTASACSGSGDDDHYHGTHVAGTVAALDNGVGVVGVAPGARLWAVKVLNRRGSGSDSGVIAGIDWVVARGEIEVANLSLGGSYSQALNDAVTNAVNAGVTVVVAAGNSSTNVSTSSPASAGAAVTVSALADFNGLAGGGAAPTCRFDVDDTFADFSNFGTGVDIIAPGVCITSTSPGGGYRTISGTSMASPHVAGAAALLRSVDNADTASELTTGGTAGWNSSDDPDGIKEPLLDVTGVAFTPILVPVAAPPPPPPTGGVSLTGSATSQKSSWTATVTVTGGDAGTTYSGVWSPGAIDQGCTADGTGGCSFSRSGIAKKTSSVTWTASSGQKVTILRP